MQTQSTVLQLEATNSNSFLRSIDDIVKKHIKTIQPPPPNDDDTFITRIEVAKMFGVSLPTIHAWMNAGVLIPYKIANKTRFKKSEVLAACKPLKSTKA